MTLRSEILPDAQRSVLERVGPVATALGFYLAGGTAVALRLGHRVSVDLDWFADVERLDPFELAATLQSRLPGLAIAETGAGALHAELDGVRLTFLRYRYPLLGPLEDAAGFRIASLSDLVCMKLAAATQRGDKKDFFDIVAICEGGIDLSAALDLFRRKFGLASAGHVLVSLTYFDDSEGDPDPRAENGLTWPEVKRRLVGWVKELSAP